MKWEEDGRKNCVTTSFNLEDIGKDKGIILKWVFKM
jgi:hypothetical protein